MVGTVKNVVLYNKHEYPLYTVHAKDRDGWHDGYDSAHDELHLARATASAGARRGVAQRIYKRNGFMFWPGPPRYSLVDEYPGRLRRRIER